MTAEKCRELLLAVIKGFRELSNLMTGKTVRGQQWQPGSLYLENRILKNQKSNIQIERSERRDKTSEDDRNVVDERSSKQQRYRDISVLYVKRKETLWRHKGQSERESQRSDGNTPTKRLQRYAIGLVLYKNG